MATTDSDPRSILQDEAALRWGFLEDEAEPCAVVSKRMELVYINAAARALGAADWFGKRCFEVLPVGSGQCAWQCLTIQAVGESDEVVYGEENLSPADGAGLRLGVAVIPLAFAKTDPASAILFLRRKEDTPGFREDLLRDAGTLRKRVASRLS